jgi:hypothetical protein
MKGINERVKVQREGATKKLTNCRAEKENDKSKINAP